METLLSVPRSPLDDARLVDAVNGKSRRKSTKKTMAEYMAIVESMAVKTRGRPDGAKFMAKQT